MESLLEMSPQHLADIFGMWEIEGSINLIENIHGCGFEEEQREDEGECQQGFLSPAQLGQILPYTAKRHPHSQAIQYRLSWE